MNDADEKQPREAPLDLRDELLHLVLDKAGPEERETIELVGELFFALMAETDALDPRSLAREAERSMDQWLAKRMRLLVGP